MNNITWPTHRVFRSRISTVICFQCVAQLACNDIACSLPNRWPEKRVLRVGEGKVKSGKERLNSDSPEQ